MKEIIYLVWRASPFSTGVHQRSSATWSCAWER